MLTELIIRGIFRSVINPCKGATLGNSRNYGGELPRRLSTSEINAARDAVDNVAFPLSMYAVAWLFATYGGWPSGKGKRK